MSTEYTKTVSTSCADGRTITICEWSPVYEDSEQERVLKAAKAQLLSIFGADVY